MDITLSYREKILLAFTAAYILIFGFHYARDLNFEFLAYIGVLVFGFIIVYVTLPRTNFPLHILWGLSIWGLLHMAGGSVHVGNGVLYALHLIPIFDGGGEFYILKMDQVIHAFGFGVVALLARHLLIKQMKDGGATPAWIDITAVCVAMGLGAVNEIIEFLAVIFIPETGVGGYYNTSLDLVFNALGAIAAILFVRAKASLKTKN